MIEKSKSKLYESALIKSIRRCLVDDSIYWAKVLIDIGCESIIWRRLFIHISEDIGLANPSLPATVRALYENYQFLKSEPKAFFEADGASDLPIIHAVMLMVESEKSRAVDNALTYWRKYNEEDKEIPDYAIDFHSPKGRRIGRDIRHFYSEAALIENEALRIYGNLKL